jgi:putative acetyltransferase
VETVRPYRDADAAPLHALYRAAVLEGAAGHYSAAELADWAGPPEMPETWAARHAAHVTLIAEAGGEITGYMMMHADGHLDMAFVRPDRRGTGTADLLYREILAAARDRGVRRMTVVASRLMQRFLGRRGWHPAPELAAALGETAQNRAMALDLAS